MNIVSNAAKHGASDAFWSAMAFAALKRGTATRLARVRKATEFLKAATAPKPAPDAPTTK